MKNNSQPSVASIHWPSIAQLALSLLAIISCWGLAMLLVFFGVLRLLFPSGVSVETSSMFVFAFSNALGGLLVIPSAGYSLARLLNRPISLPAWLRNPALAWLPTGLVILLPLVIFLGDRVSRAGKLTWLLLPPLHILAAGAPILWFIFLGRRKLPVGSPQRAWGVFASGLIIGPAIMLVLELTVLAVLFITWMVYIASQPALVQELVRLAESIDIAPSPEAVARVMQPYLLRPAFILAVFAYVAGIVPLIEEVFKPVGIWLLAGRDLSPAEGFTAGMISGTGYALFENFLLTNMGGDWAVTLVTRIGTSLLHVTTASLTGWALAVAWKKKRYWILALGYLLAVLLHSAWNTAALVTAAPALPLLTSYPDTVLKPIGVTAYVFLGFLTVLLFVILIGANRLLRRGVESVNKPPTLISNASEKQPVIPDEPAIRSDNAINPPSN